MLSSSRCDSRVVTLFALLVAIGGTYQHAWGQTGIGTVPNLQFQAGRTALLAGDYQGAIETFQDGGRSAIRTADSRWVDSAAFHAMVGECFYRRGQLPQALDQFNAAIDHFIAHSTWMLSIDFPNAIEPARAGGLATPWGTPVEAVPHGKFAERYQLIRTTLNLQGAGVGNQGNTNLVGGREAIPVNCADIVRAVCTAIRRRRQIMGPLCEFDPRTDRLLNALQTGISAPNHWTQCWGDVQRGCGFAAGGKIPQAIGELTKSLKAGDLYYHPLTATAFNELGQIALEQKKYDQAGTCFMEASYAAAAFGNVEEMEEAFRGAHTAWLMTGADKPFEPLVPAAAWAKKGNYDALHAQLLVLGAENMNLLGRPAEADVLLQQVQREINRTDMQKGKLGAAVAFEQARLAFATGNHSAGATALASALKFEQGSSEWLFQINIATRYHAENVVSDRMGDLIFSDLLREPTSADWSMRPFETLAVASSDYSAAYERWMEVLINRKDNDRALEVADRLKRHRFFSSIPLGARLPALRAVLETPLTALSPRAQAQRATLLQNYPVYEQLMTKTVELRDKLGGLPLVPDDRTQKEQQTKLLQELAATAEKQETILRNMAVRREAADAIMPPIARVSEFRNRMTSKQLLLYYATTSGGTYGFAVSKDKFGVFKLGTPTKVKADITLLLKELGNLDKNSNVSAETIASHNWKTVAKRLLKAVASDAKDDVWTKFDELIVVPDGPLWYLPFECLVAGDGSDAQPLISQIKIRYAPTLGLASPDSMGHRGEGRTAVVTGKLHPRDDVSVATAGFEAISKVTPQAERLGHPTPVASPVYATICDRLVVFHDIDEPGKAGPYGWSPLPVDKARKGSDLGEWLALPAGGPNLVVLPGFHTPAETAIRKPALGEEMFLASCALMSSGSQTVLLSRWRPGGKTSYDLIREFVQEQPNMSAAEAWQRSVQLAMASPVGFKDEPRVKSDAKDSAPTAEHPFFWAAYCVVDRGSAPGQEPLPPVDVSEDALKPAAAKAGAKDEKDDMPAEKGKKPAPKAGEKMPPEKMPNPGGAKPNPGKAGGPDDEVMDAPAKDEPEKPAGKPVGKKPAAKKK